EVDDDDEDVVQLEIQGEDEGEVEDANYGDNQLDCDEVYDDYYYIYDALNVEVDYQTADNYF
ncbi:MAG: hypothetical protein EZS28_012532, partial [Streblomastix strix]